MNKWLYISKPLRSSDKFLTGLQFSDILEILEILEVSDISKGLETSEVLGIIIML